MRGTGRGQENEKEMLVWLESRGEEGGCCQTPDLWLEEAPAHTIYNSQDMEAT